MSQNPTHSSSFKWWICTLLLLASTLNYMDRQALSQTSKRISDHFQIQNKELGQLESGFNIAFAVGVFSIGLLIDRLNIRLMYPLIVVLWSLAGVATGYADSFTFMLVCRIALGLFEAGNIPFGVLTVKRILKPEERALGNGMFQSGTALGAIITPYIVILCLTIVAKTTAEDDPLRWQLPFRVVGAAGFIWAFVWLLTVRTHHVQPPATQTEHDPGDSYAAIFRNRRFWVAGFIVVMSINAPWRSFGFWLPKMLQVEKGYSEAAVQWWVSPGFFAAADLGSIAVGIAILRLSRRGFTLHRARVLCFASCSVLAAGSMLAALFPKGPMLIAVLYIMGFGALGLFPIYYALSQEISTRHQGKVTGTLSCMNGCFLAMLFPLQGLLIDELQSFSAALAVMGLFPFIGLAAVLLFWTKRERGNVA